MVVHFIYLVLFAQCDEARPACGRCVKAKRVCPGYLTGLDLVLRPQNAVAKATVERRQKARDRDDLVPTNGRTSHHSDSLSPVSSPTSIPPVLPESESIHMLGFFFTSYVLYPHDPNTDRGYMEALPMIYPKTNTSLALSSAVTAVSQCIYGTWTRRTRDLAQLDASSAYIHALSTTSRALLDPTEAAKDETMMAICLLGFYEAMVDAYRSKLSSARHYKGAAALVENHKGGPRSELVNRMVMGIRRDLVVRAIDQGTSIDMTSAIWQDRDDLPQNPATAFDLLSAEAANLLTKAKTILGSNKARHSEVTRFQKQELVNRAIACDSKFASWPHLLPTHLFPLSLQAAAVPVQVSRAGLYADTCDIYYDISTCTLWNNWRSLRLKILKIVAEHGTQAERGVAIKSLQSLADEICASIPFVLGDRKVFTPLWASQVIYPGQGALPKSHHLNAAAHGGWHLLDPMREVFYIAPQYLRVGQLQWICVQLNRLQRIYEAIRE